jgi:predicted TIM-barrel fold metal-dependent hydrolase
MMIDIHTHAWPEKVALRAQESLEVLFRTRLVALPTVDNLLRFMGNHHIDISVVCAVATKPEQVVSINDWLFSIRSNYIKVFCALHPDFLEWEKEIDRIRRYGDGIKLQPEFQGFDLDSEKMFPQYGLIEHCGLPLLFHCGRELSGTFPERSSPQRLLEVKKHFPSLTLIAAHFGGFQLWDEVAECLLGQDIYLDTSFFFDFLPEGRVRELLLSHRGDRILFGTDFPLIDQKKDIEFLRRLEVPEQLKGRIFYENAKELLGGE